MTFTAAPLTAGDVGSEDLPEQVKTQLYNIVLGGVLNELNPAIGTGLNIDVDTGKGVIAAHRVHNDVLQAVSVPASVTDNWLYATLSRNGSGDVTGVSFATAAAKPDDSFGKDNLIIAQFTTDASTVTSLTDKRKIASKLANIMIVSADPVEPFTDMFIFNTTDKQLKRYDGTSFKVIGGGGMFVKAIFGSFTEVDPSDRIGYATQHVLIIGETGRTAQDFVSVPSSTGVVETDGGAVATFADSQEYKPIDAETFNSKPIGKIFVSVPISGRGAYSPATSANIKLNATNCKIEILDGVTVKATISLANDRTTSTSSATNRSITSFLFGSVDLADFVFTDFRIKLYIETTVSTTTNLTNHFHSYIGTNASETGTALGKVGVATIEVKE